MSGCQKWSLHSTSRNDMAIKGVNTDRPWSLSVTVVHFSFSLCWQDVRELVVSRFEPLLLLIARIKWRIKAHREQSATLSAGWHVVRFIFMKMEKGPSRMNVKGLSWGTWFLGWTTREAKMMVLVQLNTNRGHLWKGSDITSEPRRKMTKQRQKTVVSNDNFWNVHGLSSDTIFTWLMNYSQYCVKFDFVNRDFSSHTSDLISQNHEKLNGEFSQHTLFFML